MQTLKLDFDSEPSRDSDRHESSSGGETFRNHKRLSELPPANPLQVGIRTLQIVVKNPFFPNNELPIHLMQSLMNPINKVVPQKQNFFDEAFTLQQGLEKSFQAPTEPPYTSLFDYYIHKHETLVYQKYDTKDLNAPVQIGTKRYFASIVYDLKKHNKREFGTLHQTTAVKAQTSNALKFDAQFESGNLFCAFQRDKNEYDLVLQNDINSKGHTQWFFFAVNVKQSGVVKFNLINLMKSGSLFKTGMQPICFSEVANQRNPIGWQRQGQCISYLQNTIRKVMYLFNTKEGSQKEKCYYTLSFTLNLPHDNDKVWIAHSYPYTYTQLGLYLNRIFENSSQNKYINRKTLCKSIAGNKCEVITITSGSLKQRSMRRGIFLLARQHPGEPQGSYMMEGVIDYLLSDELEAQYIRSAAVIKIVPMVNIDGVILGNYRCSLTGCDLNRRWKNPKKKIHPEVLRIKEILKSFTRERSVRLVCDFHGHSRKTQAFFYGCISAHTSKYLNPRIFPYLMSQITPIISFPFSTFGVQKGKECTARVRIYQEMRVPLVYTLEVSFQGYNRKPVQIAQHSQTEIVSFTIQDYKDIGRQFCLGLYKILYDDVGPVEFDDMTKPNISPRKDENQSLKQIEEELRTQIGDINKEDRDDSVGSDTDVSEDNLEDEFLISIIPGECLSKKQKKLKEQLKEQAMKDKQQIKRGSMIKEVPIQKNAERPKSIQREKKQYNWIVDRGKKKDEQRDINGSGKIMVDKCIQTDEKMYRFRQLQSLENGCVHNNLSGQRYLLTTHYIRQRTREFFTIVFQFNQTASQKLFAQQLKSQQNVTNVQAKLNVFQQKNFKINSNFHYPVQSNLIGNFKSTKEDLHMQESRIRQMRAQSAVRKPVFFLTLTKPVLTQETIKFINTNCYLNSNENRYLTLTKNKTRRQVPVGILLRPQRKFFLKGIKGKPTSLKDIEKMIFNVQYRLIMISIISYVKISSLTKTSNDI